MRFRTGPIVALAMMATLWVLIPAVFAVWSRRASLAALGAMAMLALVGMVVGAIVAMGQRNRKMATLRSLADSADKENGLLRARIAELESTKEIAAVLKSALAASRPTRANGKVTASH